MSGYTQMGRERSDLLSGELWAAWVPGPAHSGGDRNGWHERAGLRVGSKEGERHIRLWRGETAAG